MPAGTAAAVLADYQPLKHLQHANYQLREENRQLRAQVHELLEWKERAVRHMVAQEPRRTKAQRQLRDAAKLQLKLKAVEESLQEREELEATAIAMQQDQQALHQRIDALESENLSLQDGIEQLRESAESTRQHLRDLSDAFRVHLEKLVAIRESVDPVISALTDNGSDQTRVAATTTDSSIATGVESQELVKSSFGADASTELPPVRSNDDVGQANAELISGLSAVSEKCLLWVQEHTEASFQRHQQKAALFEAQHEELLKLRAQLHARHASSPPVGTLAAENQQQALEIARLQHAAHQLENERVEAERALDASVRTHRELAGRVRELAREVRQFLRLVRGEIRRKFGYVPEAIAHAESWARVAEALDALLRSGVAAGESKQ